MSISRSQTSTRLDLPSPVHVHDIVARIWLTVKPLTMVPEAGVRFAIDQTIRVLTEGIPGVLVECGVWRGGCSIAMLLAQREIFGRVERPVYLLDSFEGLPPAQDRDGPLAELWQRGETSGATYDNCAASVSEVEASLKDLGFTSNDYRLVAGWFEDTVPEQKATFAESNIALLRLDGDWYESTKVCLDNLMPAVANNAVVILDDYYAWDGCARAVHEYLSQNDVPYRVRSLPAFVGAYLVKKQYRDQEGSVDDGIAVGSVACSIADREYYVELEKTNDWLEQQRANWQRTAETKEQQMRELTAHIEESGRTAEAHEAQVRELTAYIQELEGAKLWLEEQRANWQRTAESYMPQ